MTQSEHKQAILEHELLRPEVIYAVGQAMIKHMGWKGDYGVPALAKIALEAAIKAMEK